jgi:hypothetical protein
VRKAWLPKPSHSKYFSDEIAFYSFGSARDDPSPQSDFWIVATGEEIASS